MSVMTSQLPAIQRKDLASNDYIPVVDSSEHVLKKLAYDQIAGNIISGVCHTEGSACIKIATTSDPNYVPQEGDIIYIRFTDCIGLPSIQLKINNDAQELMIDRLLCKDAQSLLVVKEQGKYNLITCEYPFFSEYCGQTKAKLNIKSDISNMNTWYQFDGSTQVDLINCKEIATIDVNNWSNSVDAGGYYTNVVLLTNKLNTYYRPTISISGQTNSSDPTSEQRTAYEYVQRFDFEESVSVQSMTARSKIKPSVSFYVLITGNYIEYVTE